MLKDYFFYIGILLIISIISIIKQIYVKENLAFNSPYMRKSYLKHNIKYDVDNSTLSKNGYKIKTKQQMNSCSASFKSNYKDITSKILAKNDLPINYFYKWNLQKSVDQNIQIVKNNKKLIFPLVIKPTAGTQGYGVNVGIESYNQLKKHAKQLLKNKNQILIENQAIGNNYRIMVFNDKIIDIIQRIEPYVIGNGKNKLSQLIHGYNKKQVDEHNYAVHNINYNLIKKQGYTNSSIIPKGKVIKLTNTSNYHNGSKLQRISISDVHPDNIYMFLKVNRVLGMNLSGIDYMANTLTVSHHKQGKIIEVNGGPDMKIHYVADKNNRYFAVDRFVKQIFM